MTAIAKLTTDDLKETSREKTQLSKLNELTAALNNLTGSGTAGAIAATTLTTSDNVTIAGALPGLTSTGQLVLSTVTATASTVGSCEAFRGSSVGTYDTTAGALVATGALCTVTATRSAGSNTLINTGMQGTASGGQLNNGVVGSATGASTINTGVTASASGGSSNIALNAALGGDVKLAGASDKIGCFAATPVVKQTVAGTVITATNGTAMRSLLTALAAYGIIIDTSTDV